MASSSRRSRAPDHNALHEIPWEEADGSHSTRWVYNGVLASGLINNRLYHKGLLVNGHSENIIVVPGHPNYDRHHFDGEIMHGVYDDDDGNALLWHDGNLAHGMIGDHPGWEKKPPSKFHRDQHMVNGVLKNGLHPIDPSDETQGHDMWHNGRLLTGAADGLLYHTGIPVSGKIGHFFKGELPTGFIKEQHVHGGKLKDGWFPEELRLWSQGHPFDGERTLPGELRLKLFVRGYLADGPIYLADGYIYHYAAGVKDDLYDGEFRGQYIWHGVPHTGPTSSGVNYVDGYVVETRRSRTAFQLPHRSGTSNRHR